MLQDIDTVLSATTSFAHILANTLVAFFCGLLISLLYRFVHRGPSYSNSFAHTMILLAMITAVMIMVIGSNLARAFGLVGAMSIIRFRTAVKDMQDIVFIFFSLAAGLAAGAGLHVISISGTVLIGLVTIMLSRTTFAQRKRKDFLLQMVMKSGPEQAAPYLPVFHTYCRRSKLVNVKTLVEDDTQELSFYVNLSDENESASFVQALRSLRGIERINLFFDEEHY